LSGTAKERRERAQVPEIAFCEEKQRLTDLLLEAIHELTSLHSRQTQTVIESNRDFPRFDVLLQLAQQKKDNAKYAWIEHVESHRCSESGEFEDLWKKPDKQESE
jgi:hypothetical protein